MNGAARRLVRLVPAARQAVRVTAGLSIIAALLVVAQAWLLADLVSRAFLGDAGLSALTPALTALAAVVVARAVLGWAQEAAASRAGALVVTQVRALLLDHVLLLGPRHPGLPPTGRLAALTGRGVDALDGYAGRYLPQRIVAVVVPLVVGCWILTADWLSALLLAVTVPLVPVFMVLIGLHTKQRVGRQWRTLTVLAAHFLDVVAGLDVLTAFGRARGQERRIAAVSERHRVQTMRTLRVAFLSALTLELLASLSVALVAVSVGLRLVAGDLDLATGLLVIVLAPEVFLPLRAVSAGYHDNAEGAAAAEQVFGILDLPVPARAGGRAPHPAAGPLQLEAVTVDGRGGPVLDHVSLTIAPGQVLGLTGASGAGKSTLLDLLLGWRRPDGGRVTVDGVDLATVDRAAWLQQVAWVPQRPALVRGTIADNLRLAAPDAAPERLAAAAAAAALELPLGTRVQERGLGLSTGQQRRVALARALLADRPLLLLDEPTEGLDGETEATVLRTLPAALAGRTVVLVSHRSAVLGVCDRVVALPSPGTRAPDSAEPDEPEAAVPEPARGATLPAAAGRAGTASSGLRALLPALRPHRGRLAVAVLAGTGALGSTLALAATSAWLISSAALQPPVLSLVVAIVGVRTFALAKAGLRYGERLASHDAALRILATLRVRLWRALVRLGPAATGRLRSGDLLARLVGDVDAQQDLVVRAFVPAASAAIAGVGAVIGLGLLVPGAGPALAAGLLCAGVLAPLLTLRVARSPGRRTAELTGVVVADVVELLDAAPDLLAFGTATRRRTALAAVDARLGALRRRAAGAAGLGAAASVLGIGGAAVACTALGVAALRAGSLEGPALAVLALTPLAAAELVAGLPEAARRWSTALPAADRLAALEAARPPVVDAADPRPASPGRTMATQGLAVRWPGASQDAVDEVDLRVPAGGALVLTGPTGSGKSTVLAALLRTLDPRAGRVLMDDVDTRGVLADDVRSRIAWCGPAPHLFDSTLRDNLRLARPDAADDRIVAALRRAGLGDWLAGLPEGLDTAVGRHGGAVSGGERQRIGLARALLAARPLLVLDEPTAHLDTATAERVCADVVRSTAGRTAIVTSHRPEAFPGLPHLRMPAAEPRARVHRAGHAGVVLSATDESGRCAP
ncbi:thiol reductant ABC exporter subunit CydD [Geodermatophilus sp. SYSU D00814]